MSKNLEMKKQVVSDIVKKFQDAQSVVIVKYSGLTVEQVTGLRAQFRANGVDYCVLKNTLVRRALHELNIEGLDDVLNGPSAFAFGMNDPVSPAKILNDFIALILYLKMRGSLKGTPYSMTEVITCSQSLMCFKDHDTVMIEKPKKQFSDISKDMGLKIPTSVSLSDYRLSTTG